MTSISCSTPLRANLGCNALVGLLFVGVALSAPAPTPVSLNSLGYLPDAPKQANFAASAGSFEVVRFPEGIQVWTGQASGPVENADTGEELYEVDFSDLTEPGQYQVRVPGVGESAPFRIGPDVYRSAFRTVARAMYLWRCGTAVEGTHAGSVFAHALCHTNDAWLDLVGGDRVQKASVGGWHDAGDYNKYVVNAGVTVGAMFRAWEDFGAVIRDQALNLPESGGVLPEFLAELKWETDWLLTMQAEDGSVYHKLSTKRFGSMILPELETAERYFSPWSTAATADFVAMLAQAARNFRPYDATYADRCLAAARKSYGFLREHPEDVRPDLSAFRTGSYRTRDADDRLWAAAELWSTTGNPQVLVDLEERVRELRGRVAADFDWGNVANLALFTYVASPREGRDASLVETVCSNLLATADAMISTRDQHGYRRPLGTRYSWGGNGSVARQVLVLQAAYRIDSKRVYRETALDALNHLFGRNVYGQSFVTGLGFRPPMQPHDRRSAGDAVGDPWPGNLVGGPNPKATDWKDEQEDYRTNEIAINWNGALIYALAAFLGPTVELEAASVEDHPAKTPDVVFVPTPQKVVDRILELAEIRPGDVVYDLGCGDGRIVVTAAKRYGVEATGFDIDPERIQDSLANVRTNEVDRLVTIRQQDIFTLDLREASVVTLYLLPDLNVQLMPQLAQMKPGSRILSHDFDMEGAKPILVERVMVKAEEDDELAYEDVEHTIYKWVVPWEPEGP